MDKPRLPFPLRFFDREDEYLVVEGDLPHWCQSGTLCFITWRTCDSMPREVLERWYSERDDWLAKHGISADGPWWKQLHSLPLAAQGEFQKLRHEKWESSLDECHGECLLERRDVGRLVADSLMHFDEQRYVITDYVVMPNHVHVLAAFPDADNMLAQCDSWKHFTAVKVNEATGRSGRFWQSEAFDHLVRSLEQFEYLRTYIATNPRNAKLRTDQYFHYSRDLTSYKDCN